MKLNNKQKIFIEKRRRLMRSWSIIGSLLLFGIIASLGWMSLRNPLLVNPFKVASRLNSGTVEQSTLIIMAAMLPVVFLACFFLLAALILFCFSAFSNEKKHLKIIDSLLRNHSGESSQ